jgi:aldehyde:ferredoxin oxidoreductase
MMANGYWNKILWVDLTSGTSRVEDVDETIWKLCIGGAGFGAKVLLEEIDANVDPFEPENPLIFALGPYQAGNVPGNAKWTVVTKSPLTKTYADSAAGANWGLALKRAGYDALVITGKASRPVYLLIDEDHVEIKDAQSLWGLDSYQTIEHFHKIDRNLAVVAIGPAGEKLVRFACLVADGHSFAGRCGIGAVMGAKRLKAIAVKGRKKVPVHDEDGLAKKSKQLFQEIYSTAKEHLRRHGTPELCVTAESFGDMPIKYWSGDTWPEGAEKVGAPRYTEVLRARPLPCMNCPIGCHRYVEIESSRYVIRGPGPEYETLGMLGTNLLIDDLEAIAKANDLCNRLGIDTISTGACVGLAMEWYEKGWLTKEQTGLQLTWGNAEAMIAMVEQIGTRTGFLGELFADGSLSAAKRIHPEAEQDVAHVKGLDYPAHDPRACFSLAINYATGTRGACHMRGVTEDVEMGLFFIPELGIVPGWSELFSPQNKVELTIKLQDLCAWLNSLVICVFMLDGGGLSLSQLVELFNLITGWDWGIDEVMKSGERIFTLQRLVNLRDGHGRKTDTLPYKMTVPAKHGPRAGKVPPFEFLLSSYYNQRGWDEQGRPQKQTLQRLELEFSEQNLGGDC